MISFTYDPVKGSELCNMVKGLSIFKIRGGFFSNKKF